ncbi:type II CAAX prenyl endopeptidase Rce1 family protein [Pseudactinotalea sp. Z1739]
MNNASDTPTEENPGHGQPWARPDGAPRSVAPPGPTGGAQVEPQGAGPTAAPGADPYAPPTTPRPGPQGTGTDPYAAPVAEPYGAAPGHAPMPTQQQTPPGHPGYQPAPGHPGYQPAPGYPGYQQAPGHSGYQPAPGYPGYQQAPQPPRAYHHALRRDQGGNVWRGILALVMFGVGFVLLQIPATVVILLQSDVNLLGEDLMSGLRITPLGMLVTNLSLAALWPLSLGIQRLLYGVRPGSLHSVAGKIRWRLFLMLAAVLLPAYLLYTALNPLVFPTETGVFTATHAAFIVIAILTTPLQSAGEEVGFRGLVQRAVGGWFVSPRVALVIGTLISAVLFAIAHGAGDMWLNVYYVVFAVALTVMTWRTQGLEAAIIVHAANNTFIMILNSALGMDFDGMFDREAGVGGPFMLVGMAMCVLATALVWWRTRTPKAREAMRLPEPVTPNPWEGRNPGS